MDSLTITTDVEVKNHFADVSEGDDPATLLGWASRLLGLTWADQEAYALATGEIAIAQQSLDLEFRHQFDLHFAAFQYHAFPQVLVTNGAGFIPVPLRIQGNTVRWITKSVRPTTWLERLRTKQQMLEEDDYHVLYHASAFNLDDSRCPAVPSIALQTVSILRQVGIKDGQMYVIVEGSDPIFAVKIGSGWYMIALW